MEKSELRERASEENIYEIKGSLELLRGDMKHYFKQIGIVLILIFVALVVIAFKV
jgi:hypothetical protein